MITIVCPKCALALRTVGEHDEVDALLGTKTEWYPDQYPCPGVDCGGKMVMTDTIESAALSQLTLIDLTPPEVYSALYGLGLPEERDCGVEAVTNALVGNTIARIVATQIRGSNRTAIRHIYLSDGRRLSLGSSSDGATVYRIAAPRSYVKEVSGGE